MLVGLRTGGVVPSEAGLLCEVETFGAPPR
jgi:hypothetical protein